MSLDPGGPDDLGDRLVRLVTGQPAPTAAHLIEVLDLYRQGLLGPQAVELARRAYQRRRRSMPESQGTNPDGLR